MDFVNELAQEALEARTRLRELLKKQACDKLSAAESKEVAFLEQDLDRLDREHVKERARLDAETAELLQRPSGRLSGARPSAHLEVADEAPALTALPQLSARSVAAIGRLYGDAQHVDPEARRQSFRATVLAALGGNGLHPSVLAASQSEGVPADGGFAVETEVARGIFVRAFEGSVWARIGARIEPMTSEEKVVVALDDADETNDAEAGVTAGWTGESEAATAQKITLRRVVLHARKLLVLAQVPAELGEDAPDFLPQLEAALFRAIGKRFDHAVLTATGAGKPMGIIGAAATITVSKVSGQAADTILWQNVVDMWSRLAPGSHEASWWLTHPTCLPQLMQLSLPIGVAGSVPRGALEAGGPTGYMLMGRPVVVTGRVKPIGDLGDLILVDPSQLAIGIRRQIAVERSPHALFSSDAIAVRGKFRGDARPLWEKARTLPEGSVTVSPYVILQAR